MEINHEIKDPDFFLDVSNPTEKELIKWAYGNYYQPIQDFELFVTQDPFLILTFAEDVNCPNKKFFLMALYIYIGDAVRTIGITDKNNINYIAIVERASLSKNQDLKKFAERSIYLIKNPDTYDCKKWGFGYYVNE